MLSEKGMRFYLLVASENRSYAKYDLQSQKFWMLLL